MAQVQETPPTYGVYPVDFILESVLNTGLAWFRTDATAKNKVFGHLLDSILVAGRYGQTKIDEIGAYINNNRIRVVQHWGQVAQNTPCFSIQLLDGREDQRYVGMADHDDDLDTIDDVTNEVVAREGILYSPISDQIQIGIHSHDTPDLAKYLYYLAVYILEIYKPTLEAGGLELTTFQATDLSRINEYLPENIFSRFINYSILTFPKFSGSADTIITAIEAYSASEGGGISFDTGG